MTVVVFGVRREGVVVIESSSEVKVRMIMASRDLTAGTSE